MKKPSTIFLQAVIVLIGVVALILMIRLPQLEGRAANLDLVSIYADPFILYGYATSIAFFVALYKAFKLLGYVGQNKVFSPSVEDVAHARRVIAAMGDGTGAVMIDGKMEDDASVKQCQVMVALAEELAAIDPELKKQYDAIATEA